MPQISHLFLIALAIVIVGGIFIFNFDDKIFASFGSKKISDINRQQLETSIVSSQISEKIVSEIPEKTFQNQQESPQHTPKISEKITPSYELQEYKKQKAEKLENNEKSNILKFEKSEFALAGSGKAWEAARHLEKKISINLNLVPIKGTDLTQFELYEGKIKIGESSFQFNKGTVNIKKSEISIDLPSKGKGFPFSTLKGEIESTISTSKYSAKISLADQLFYLNSADKTPFHIYFDGVLISQIQK